MTIAELYLNLIEHTAVMGDAFGRRNRESLDRFARNAFAISPLLGRRLAENPAGYLPALRGLLDTGR